MSELPAVGAIVGGRYRIDRLVGVGGMAHVFAARHLGINADIAIKFLDPSLISDSDAMERFSREGRAMTSLSSKHTVRVYDAAALPSGLPYIVMELLEGKDLEKISSERGALPLEEACDYIEQACEAVAEAHQAGLIHRDIKLANLFVTMVQGKPLLRVLDFGIARAVGGSVGTYHTLTRVGDLVGTLSYMSPEQMRDSKSVEPRSDIWALGNCLYRLVTGHSPFTLVGEVMTISAIMSSPPTPIAEYRQDVPAVLASVIMRCLRKPPAERFATANDLRRAIGEARSLMALAPLNESTAIMGRTVTREDRRDPSSNRVAVAVSTGSRHDPTRISAAEPRPARLRHDMTVPLAMAPVAPVPPRSSGQLPLLPPSARGPSHAPSAAPAPAPPSPVGFILVVAGVALVVVGLGLVLLLVLSRQH